MVPEFIKGVVRVFLWAMAALSAISFLRDPSIHLPEADTQGSAQKRMPLLSLLRSATDP